MNFSLSNIQHDFNRHAGDYDANSGIQRDVLRQAWRQLVPHLDKGMHLLDAGCGTGYSIELWKDMRLSFPVFSCDVAESMCKIAAGRSSLDHPLHIVCADVGALPYPDGSMDAALCSLMMQWVYPALQPLHELYRVLKPGGKLMITTFAQSTLHELREAFSAIDDSPHVSAFPTMQAWQSWARQGGFILEQESSEFQQIYYPDVQALMRTIRSVGASNKVVNRRRGFTARGRFTRMEALYRKHYESEKGLPATWEIAYLLLRKPVDTSVLT